LLAYIFSDNASMHVTYLLRIHWITQCSVYTRSRRLGPRTRSNALLTVKCASEPLKFYCIKPSLTGSACRCCFQMLLKRWKLQKTVVNLCFFVNELVCCGDQTEYFHSPSKGVSSFHIFPEHHKISMCGKIFIIENYETYWTSKVAVFETAFS